MFRVLTVAFCGLAGLHASVVYSNVGAGDAVAATGWLIGSGINLGGPGLIEAFSFVPLFDASISSIDFPVYTRSGPATLMLAIYTNDTGHPGTSLGNTASIIISNSTTQLRSIAIAPVVVTTNQTYWLVASVADPLNTELLWGQNTIGQLGVRAAQLSGTTTWNTNQQDIVRGSFRLKAADTPEPAMTCALGVILFAIGVKRRVSGG